MKHLREMSLKCVRMSLVSIVLFQLSLGGMFAVPDAAKSCPFPIGRAHVFYHVDTPGPHGIDELDKCQKLMRILVRAVVDDDVEQSFFRSQQCQVRTRRLVEAVDAGVSRRHEFARLDIAADDCRKRKIGLPRQQRVPADSKPVASDADLQQLDPAVAERSEATRIQIAIAMTGRAVLVGIEERQQKRKGQREETEEVSQTMLNPEEPASIFRPLDLVLSIPCDRPSDDALDRFPRQARARASWRNTSLTYNQTSMS